MPKIASLALRRLSIVLWVFFGREGLHRVVGFKYRHSSFLSFLSGLTLFFPFSRAVSDVWGVREVTCYNAFSMIASRSRLLAEVKDSAADDGWMEKW
jgi:hypothetical protein